MVRSKRKPGEPPRNGTELQRDLLVAGKEAGWLVTMTRRSQMCRTEGSSGFPDLHMVQPGRYLYIECKSKYEKLSPEQIAWAGAIIGEPWEGQESVYHFANNALGHRHQVRWMVARPVDLDTVLAIIRNEGGTWWAQSTR